MAKPKWITIGTTEGSMNGLSEITAAAYTGRVAREGTITGTTAGGATDTTAVTQEGAAEVITIKTKTYSTNAVGQNITIQGKSNSADLNIVLGESVIPGLSYKLAVAGVTDESWDGNEDITVDGDPGASAIYDFTLTVTVPENKSESALVAKFAVKNANADVTSGEITINQAAGVKNYAIPVISEFKYPDGDLSVMGESVIPTLSYSQTWGWNDSNTGGGTLLGTLISPIEGTTFEFKGASVESTGEVSAKNKGAYESGITKVASVTAQVTLNGKSSVIYKAQDVYQAANDVFYGDVQFTERTPSISDIPASGGTVGAAQITWSGKDFNWDAEYIALQEVTYSSGAQRVISDVGELTFGGGTPALSDVQISYSTDITASSKGTAVSTRTEVGVITITATGAAGKTATKTITVYQAANSASYGEVTIGQATPVSLNAPGETYAIVPAMKQTVTYTSGATRTESTPADNKVQLSADYSVKTAKEGFSLETNTGKVTVGLNPTTHERGGFVVTISAEGEGGKTATKDITFNQQGSDATLDLSPDTMTFAAAGETKTLTITSNDSWTLS